MVNQELIVKIMEGQLNELLEIRKRISLEVGMDPHTYGFCNLMILFHKGDFINLLVDLEKGEYQPAFKSLFRIRAGVLSGDLSKEQVDVLTNYLPLETTPWLAADMAYVIAMAHQRLGNFDASSRGYTLASSKLEEIGASRKALRAETSALAAYSCLYPDARLFVEHNLLMQKALQLNEFVTAGVEAINISREYQRLSSMRPALEYAHRAVNYLAPHAGSREEGFAILQRASVFLHMGLKAWAKLDVDRLSLFQHKDVREARKVILKEMADVTVNCSELIPTWLERLEEDMELEKLGKLEGELIFLLASGPMDRHELIEKLYGTSIDQASTEVRLRTLISRVRKKLPDLIFLDGDQYTLSDPFAGDLVNIYFNKIAQ